MVTITASTRETPYYPVTPTTEFPCDFPIFGQNTGEFPATDLDVEVNGIPTTDFIVVATFVDGISTDAIVRLPSGVTGEVIVRGMRTPRRTDQYANGAPLPIPAHNYSLNRVEATVQEIRRDTDKASGGLKAETAARIAEDTVLHGRVDKEIIDRINADNALRSLIGQGGAIEVPFYDSRLAASLANIKLGIKSIRTGGLASPGDGADAFYIEGDATKPGGFVSVGGRQWELAVNVPTLEMFGAKGDGTTDDTAARDAAYEYVGINGRVNLLDGKTYLVSNNDNPDGVTFEGKGQVVTAVPGGFWQRNTYADSQQHFGREYLSRAFDYIRNSQGGPSGTLKVRIFGDSTIALDIDGTNERPDDCIRQAFQDLGIPNIVVENQGVSGSKWGDEVYPAGHITDYLDGTTGLALIKYGLNDAYLGIDSLYSSMDTVLSSIRSHANGSLGAISIILVMPNSTFDSPNSRDVRWFEKVRQIYRVLARKYHCALFDTYSPFQDSQPLADLAMDNPYGDGRTVHPRGNMNRWIYGELMNTFFAGKLVGYKTNGFANEGAVSTVITAATMPSAFKSGNYHNRAVVANGWPSDGFVISEKNVDGGVLQTFYGYASGSPKIFQRHAVLGSDNWSLWTGTPQPIALSNGWVNQGDPWDIPLATATPDGLVFLSGLVTGGTTASGTIIGVLPAGLRPAKDHIFVVGANGGFVRISVHSDGTIKAMGAVDGTWTSFDGAIFRAA
ncbi:SGNH/GDSL hydrolase family protein [Ochrobactrum soli]|uniref:SGNH hydrolase-type esterase domain-containing protein n=1 Tax=Ochrobactrum soli TaxID=2448455 RepID=A0A2P9HJS4_9HYPH|nr:SGNH/GDSL hydrolase family protein [[Ochrobactrum] soli]SPL64401.1 hypothetical protein OHAE_268 [[Ochrobactrum] soli]